jgi:hypothetical protein
VHADNSPAPPRPLGLFSGIGVLIHEDETLFTVRYKLDFGPTGTVIARGSVTVQFADLPQAWALSGEQGVMLEIARVRLHCRLGGPLDVRTFAIDAWLPTAGAH